MRGDTTATRTYTATEARKNFSEIVDAAHFGERVLVRKRDRCVAVVSIEFMEHVEKLLELEAALETEAAQKALEDFHSKGGKTMEQLEQELDMD
jgi:prevent-host-death family protein